MSEMSEKEVAFLLSIGMSPIDVVDGPLDGHVYWVNTGCYDSFEEAKLKHDEGESLYKYDKDKEAMLYVEEV